MAVSSRPEMASVFFGERDLRLEEPRLGVGEGHAAHQRDGAHQRDDAGDVRPEAARRRGRAANDAQRREVGGELVGRAGARGYAVDRGRSSELDALLDRAPDASHPGAASCPSEP
jgi:hypothetical protein